jgi:molybdopterin synthase catalytic subunit
LKRTVPIWKREFWDGDEAWGLGAHAVQPVAEAEPVAGG